MQYCSVELLICFLLIYFMHYFLNGQLSSTIHLKCGRNESLLALFLTPLLKPNLFRQLHECLINIYISLMDHLCLISSELHFHWAMFCTLFVWSYCHYCLAAAPPAQPCFKEEMSLHIEVRLFFCVLNVSWIGVLIFELRAVYTHAVGDKLNMIWLKMFRPCMKSRENWSHICLYRIWNDTTLDSLMYPIFIFCDVKDIPYHISCLSITVQGVKQFEIYKDVQQFHAWLSCQSKEETECDILCYF